MSRARERLALGIAEVGSTSGPLVGREFLNQRRQETLNVSVGIAKRLNSLDRVADCRVVPAVVELADPRGAPPSDSMRQVHGNLPMERCRLGITPNPRWPHP